MSCEKCSCAACQRTRVSMPEPKKWQQAEVANPEQARVWLGLVNQLVSLYNYIPFNYLLYKMLDECHVRQENRYRVGLQMERFVIEEAAKPTSQVKIMKGPVAIVFKVEDIKLVPPETIDMIGEAYAQPSPRGVMRASSLMDELSKASPVVQQACVDMVGQSPCDVTDNYTCGCGNSKLNDVTDKLCWKCGAPVSNKVKTFDSWVSKAG